MAQRTTWTKRDAGLSKAGKENLMKVRVVWFVAGAATATVFWLALINGLGREWLDQLLIP